MFHLCKQSTASWSYCSEKLTFESKEWNASQTRESSVLTSQTRLFQYAVSALLQNWLSFWPPLICSGCMGHTCKKLKWKLAIKPKCQRKTATTTTTNSSSWKAISLNKKTYVREIYFNFTSLPVCFLFFYSCFFLTKVKTSQRYPTSEDKIIHTTLPN